MKWKWRWSNCVGKSEMNIFWCISIREKSDSRAGLHLNKKPATHVNHIFWSWICANSSGSNSCGLEESTGKCLKHLDSATVGTDTVHATSPGRLQSRNLSSWRNWGRSSAAWLSAGSILHRVKPGGHSGGERRHTGGRKIRWGRSGDISVGKYDYIQQWPEEAVRM